MSPEPVEQVALVQFVGAAAAQEAQHGGLAGLPAGLRHVSFEPQVPELLEDAVVLDHGAEQRVVVCREQAGQAVGLGGPVQQAPLGVPLRTARRAVVHLGEVQDVGFVIHDQAGAALVVPIHVIDTVTWERTVYLLIYLFYSFTLWIPLPKHDLNSPGFRLI